MVRGVSSFRSSEVRSKPLPLNYGAGDNWGQMPAKVRYLSKLISETAQEGKQVQLTLPRNWIGSPKSLLPQVYPMSLAAGRSYLAIPGPSVMPDRVLQAMHRAAPNIYTGELHDVTASLVPDLKRLAGTSGDVAMYIANGHGTWEAALSNVLAPGEKALVLATGRFGHGWAEIGLGLGADVEVMDFGMQSPADPARLEDRLKADKGHTIKAVLVCHVDTATGVKTPIKPLRDALTAAGHPALLMVDCIASLGCDRFEMDAWGADVMLSACQKGLMTPPGLGFVWFNDRAAAVQKAMDRVSVYWNWVPRANPEFYYQYWDGTAPTHHVYGLRAALDMIFEEGLDAVWNRHEVLASAIWAAFDRWGQGGAIRLNVADPAFRSHAVTAVDAGGLDGERIQTYTEQHLGLTLGIGLGRDPAERFFRVGHMGHVNGQMILGVVGGIETALQALNIAHGTGAVEAAAGALIQG